MSALARRDQRALWLGALIIVPVFAWRTVIMPASAWVVRTDARAEVAAGLLAREQTLLRDGPRLPAQLAKARRLLSDDSAYLFTATDTVGATAALAAWLSGTARAAGLANVRIETAPAISVPGGLLSVQVDVQGSGDTKALAEWLATVERGPRLVTVERLDVATSGDGSLAVSARVRGFAQERAR